MEKIIQTSDGTFALRPYQSDDKRGVLSLWRTAFGKEMNEELWRWKYMENPYGHQIMLCVNEEDQPVAMYSGIPYEANWKGDTVRFTHSMDDMSHPSYRGVIGGRRGVFVKTAEFFFDCYGGPQASVFMYGYPGRRHFLLGKKVLQYRSITGGVAFMSGLTSILEKNVKVFSGKIEEIKEVNESIDEVFERLRIYYPFSIKRNSTFLQWRFLAHPEKKYQIWVYKSFFTGSPRAYGVFSIEENRARLVDLFASDSQKELGDFMARIAYIFSKEGIEWIETWLPGCHFLQAAALALGFKPVQEPLGIVPVARVFHPSLSFGWAASNIFYTMADGDLF